MDITKDVAKFDSVSAAENGAWMDLIHPTEGPVVVKDGEKTSPVSIKFMGRDSAAFRRVNMNLARKRVKKAANDRLDADIDNQDTITAISSVAMDWRGFTKDGAPLKFSPEELTALLRKAPWITEQADNFIGDRANFMTA